MSKVYPATGLTGGTTGCLDAIDGTDLADKDVAIVTVQDGNMYPYVLDADSAESESSPLIISPDANAGDKRWKLVGVQGAFSHVKAKTGAAQSISDATNTTIVFGTEDEDLLDEYSNTTGVFTAKYDGQYNFNSVVMTDTYAWVDGDYCYSQLYKESSSYRITDWWETQASGNHYAMCQTNTTVQLDAGETAEIVLHHNRGSDIVLISVADYVWLSIDRIV